MIGRREGAAVAALLVALAISGCSADVTPGPVDDSGSSSLPSSEPTTDGGGHAQFAIITDYGNCDQGEADVAEMVAAWHPQIIATAGDNTQGATDCAPFTQSVGDYYSSFLTGPDGPILFPVPGNHDYEDDGAGEAAYLDYFAYLWSLSDNPLWYEVSTGNVNLFMLDSEASAEQLTEQREWLESSLSAARSESSASWNIVVFHRPPFTSGPHEPNVAMRPEAGWTTPAGAQTSLSQGISTCTKSSKSAGCRTSSQVWAPGGSPVRVLPNGSTAVWSASREPVLFS